VLEIQAALQYKSDEESCGVYQQSYAPFCGCPAPEDGCSLCPDGSPIQMEYADVKPFAEYGDNTTTCAVLEIQAALQYKSDEESCGVYQQSYAPFCGCSPPPGGCSLCPDGSPVGEAYAAVPFNNEVITCSVVESIAKFTPQDSKTCSDFRLQGLSLCGCDYAPPATSECPICIDGTSPPTAKLSTVVYTDAIMGDVTCGTFEWLSATMDSEEQCASSQAVVGAICGCDDPPPPACELCPAGQVRDLNKIVEDPVLLQLISDTSGEIPQAICGQVLWELSIDEITCSENKDALAEICCTEVSIETTTTTVPSETITTAVTSETTTTTTTVSDGADIFSDESAAASGDHSLFAVIMIASILVTL